MFHLSSKNFNLSICTLTLGNLALTGCGLRIPTADQINLNLTQRTATVVSSGIETQTETQTATESIVETGTGTFTLGTSNTGTGMTTGTGTFEFTASSTGTVTVTATVTATLSMTQTETVIQTGTGTGGGTSSGTGATTGTSVTSTGSGTGTGTGSGCVGELKDEVLCKADISEICQKKGSKIEILIRRYYQDPACATRRAEISIQSSLKEGICRKRTDILEDVVAVINPTDAYYEGYRSGTSHLELMAAYWGRNPSGNGNQNVDGVVYYDPVFDTKVEAKCTVYKR